MSGCEVPVALTLMLSLDSPVYRLKDILAFCLVSTTRIALATPVKSGSWLYNGLTCLLSLETSLVKAYT